MPLPPKSISLGPKQLDPAELAKLLNRLDEVSRAYDSDEMNQRDHVRRSFRATIIFVIPKQSGYESSFVVTARNINDGGVAFLHDKRLNPGTPCKIKIQQESGDWLNSTGEIVRCTQVIDGLHEIGMRFEATIDSEAVFDDFL